MVDQIIRIHEDSWGNLIQRWKDNATRNIQDKKIRPLNSIDPNDWREWRENFTFDLEIMGDLWSEQRKRLELASAMMGPAKAVVRDIEVLPPRPPAPAAGQAAANWNIPPVAELLDLYEARFIPDAGSELLRAQVKMARQQEGESILQWHSRLRGLWQRAYA